MFTVHYKQQQQRQEQQQEKKTERKVSKRAQGSYQTLFEEKKNHQYSHERCKNLSEEDKNKKQQ